MGCAVSIEVIETNRKLDEVRNHFKDKEMCHPNTQFVNLDDEQTQINDETQHVILYRTKNTKATICDNFLNGKKNLLSVRTYKLNNVVSIENWFLNQCPQLETIDLSGCPDIKTIGSWFSVNNRNLQHVNFSDDANIKYVGPWFLNDCMKLKTLNLIGFFNIVSIESYFLNNCSNTAQVTIQDEFNLLLMIKLFRMKNIKITKQRVLIPNTECDICFDTKTDCFDIACCKNKHLCISCYNKRTNNQCWFCKQQFQIKTN